MAPYSHAYTYLTAEVSLRRFLSLIELNQIDLCDCVCKSVAASYSNFHFSQQTWERACVCMCLNMLDIRLIASVTNAHSIFHKSNAAIAG